LAAFILVVFAFSTMPRIILHTWFASHEDVAGKKSSSAAKQVNTAAYHCNCDHVVAESPFTLLAAAPGCLAASYILVLQHAISTAVPVFSYHVAALRGPPSATCQI
jgi:hypothetical protein